MANRTVGGDELAAEVRRRLTDGPCVFHLVVPVASPVSSAVAVGSAVGDVANIGPTASLEVRDERKIARDRLTFGLEWLAGLGAEATGELSTDCDTASAVARIAGGTGVDENVDRDVDDDVADRFDEIIVSTLPTTISRWLRQDLPHRIERRVALPVTVVTGAS